MSLEPHVHKLKSILTPFALHFRTDRLNAYV